MEFLLISKTGYNVKASFIGPYSSILSEEESFIIDSIWPVILKSKI
jgi:hypothetical protein